MAPIYQALELKLSPGRYRVFRRDENGTVEAGETMCYEPMCNCHNGHKDDHAASICPEAMERMKQLSPELDMAPRKLSVDELMHRLRQSADREVGNDEILKSVVNIHTLIGVLMACGVLEES